MQISENGHQFIDTTMKLILKVKKSILVLTLLKRKALSLPPLMNLEMLKSLAPGRQQLMNLGMLRTLALSLLPPKTMSLQPPRTMFLKLMKETLDNKDLLILSLMIKTHHQLLKKRKSRWLDQLES